MKRAAGGGGGDADDEAADDAGDTNVVDLMPRTDISGHITDTLIAELNDKNWKVRRDRRLRRRVFFVFGASFSSFLRISLEGKSLWSIRCK